MTGELKTLVITTIVALALVSNYNFFVEDKPIVIPEDVQRLYQSWKIEHKKLQLGGDKAINDKLPVFYQNYLKIEQHNSNENKSYSMALNQFSDLTSEEFKAQYLNLQKPDQEFEVVELDTSDVASSVDWRKLGAVTPIKDQGQCGSCWSFSTTGALEGLNFLKGSKTLESYSEQQLVDCSHWYLNMGCHGGLMNRAFRYVMKHGITTEANYPYKAVGGKCVTNKGEFTIKSFKSVQANEKQMTAALSQQPVSVGLDASNWQHYSSGVFDDCNQKMDHGVLAVGYTDEYWIVKNSWSTKWGEEGYIRLKRGNTCGILKTASYPTL